MKYLFNNNEASQDQKSNSYSNQDGVNLGEKRQRANTNPPKHPHRCGGRIDCLVLKTVVCRPGNCASSPLSRNHIFPYIKYQVHIHIIVEQIWVLHWLNLKRLLGLLQPNPKGIHYFISVALGLYVFDLHFNLKFRVSFKICLCFW